MKSALCGILTKTSTIGLTPALTSATCSQLRHRAGMVLAATLRRSAGQASPRGIRKTLAQTMALLATGTVLLAGCASQKPKLVLDPVGPAPAPAPISSSPGSLLVYSAFD